MSHIKLLFPEVSWERACIFLDEASRREILDKCQKYYGFIPTMEAPGRLRESMMAGGVAYSVDSHTVLPAIVLQFLSVTVDPIV